MALTIPDYANATFPEQAAPDSVDFDAIVAGFNRSGVTSGFVVSQRAAGANLSVDVAAGAAEVAGVATSTGSVTNVAVTADATNPRWALITAGSGTVTATMGTAVASPVFPAIPAGRVLLAAVWVPAAATSILNANITDKRVILDIYDQQQITNGYVDLSSAQASIGGSKTFTSAHILQAGNAAQTSYGAIPGSVSEQLQNPTAATATNLVQTPGALQFSGTYWNGASSSAWSTALSSTVDNASGSTRVNVAADTTKLTGALEVGTKLVKSGSTAISATGNTSQALGQFSTTNGALAVRIHLHFVTSTGGNQRTKTYEFVVDKASDSTATYYKVLPADQSGSQSPTNDVFLVVTRPAAAASTWQFWICSAPTMTFGGTATWLVESYGDTLPVYAATLNPATASPTLPFTGNLHPSNTLDTVAGLVGIGTDIPTSTLDVAGTTKSRQVQIQDVTGGSSLLQVLNIAGTGSAILANITTAGTFLSDAAATDTLLVSSAGTLRLGVGTGVPSTLRITATDAQINDNGTARSLPRGLIAAAYTNTASVTSTSTTLVNVTTAAAGVTNLLTGATGTTLQVTAALVSGRKYLVELVGAVHSTVAGDSIAVQITPGVTPATWVGIGNTITNVYIGAAFTYNFSVSAYAVPSSSGSVTFTAQFERRAGTGTIDMGTGSMIRVTDVTA